MFEKTLQTLNPRPYTLDWRLGIERAGYPVAFQHGDGARQGASITSFKLLSLLGFCRGKGLGFRVALSTWLLSPKAYTPNPDPMARLGIRLELELSIGAL